MTRLTKLLADEKKCFGRPFSTFKFIPGDRGLYEPYHGRKLKRMGLKTRDRIGRKILPKAHVSDMIGAV